MSKKLTAYFSASGVTAKAAKILAEAAGTDLFEIKPIVPYTAADLNWMDKNSRSSVEMKDLSFRPEIAEKLSNMDEYDTIFVGEQRETVVTEEKPRVVGKLDVVSVIKLCLIRYVPRVFKAGQVCGVVFPTTYIHIHILRILSISCSACSLPTNTIPFMPRAFVA